MQRRPINGGDRPPVVVYLLGVVLVPLVTMIGLVSVQLNRIESRVRAAESLQHEIEDLAGLVELRSALQSERFFVEGIATAGGLGVDPAAVTEITGLDLQSGADRAIVATDEAIGFVDVPIT